MNDSFTPREMAILRYVISINENFDIENEADNAYVNSELALAMIEELGE